MQPVGRDDEIATVDRLIDGIAAGGASLLVTGEAGSGKTTLLDHATRTARHRGLTVLTTAGVPSESAMPFAGLQRLLRPVLRAGGEDASPHPQALDDALAGRAGLGRELHQVALAALDVLGRAAATGPLLLVLDDAQWLDAPIAEVLAFVARRSASEPIVILAAARSDEPHRLDRQGLAELRLAPLPAAAAEELLDQQPVRIVGSRRRHLLATAAGNPLALIELPLAGRDDPGATGTTPHPVTRRLIGTFAARVEEMPEATQMLLLVAAADERAPVSALLSVGTALLGTPVRSEDLGPARAARLLDPSVDEVRFRHPLVRSAVWSTAAPGRRHAVHAALAELHAADLDRRAWHLAAARQGPDEDVAAALEAFAARAAARGAASLAVQALEQAAAATGDAGRRAALLLDAAETRFELGDAREALDLLEVVRRQDLDAVERARATLLSELADEQRWSGTQAALFVPVAERLLEDGDVPRAVGSLLAIGLRCWWSNPPQETRDRVVAAADGLPDSEQDPVRLAVVALADPLGQGANALVRLRALPHDGLDTRTLSLLGAGANALWAHDDAVRFLDPAVAGLRRDGRLGLLAQALTTRAWSAFHTGTDGLGEALAEEAYHLARETRQPRFAASARAAQAAIAGTRGQGERAEALAREAEGMLLAGGVRPLLALVQLGRGAAAVAHGRHPDGHAALRRLLDPSDAVHQPFVAGLAFADLVEASLHLGHEEEAREHMARLEAMVAAVPGGVLVAQRSLARALLADRADADAAFGAATADLAAWPVLRGRALLAHGRWLRRERRRADARRPLRMAWETFDALRLDGLASIALQELRATGEELRVRAHEIRDELTAQERHIAELAACGLSNREIGGRLQLSHRTVGSHLYRTFPKLGITSRAQLARALDGGAGSDRA